MCPTCQKRPGVQDPNYGLTSCLECRSGKLFTSAEIIPERIREDRKAHKDDMIQPFNRGHLSKEYITKYGTKNIKVTDREVKNAKNVWTENSYYKDE